VKLIGSWRRVVVDLVFIIVIGSAGWWLLLKMPGKNVSKAASLSPDEIVLRGELIADVRKLGAEIGERNVLRYQELNAAAEFIERSFADAGLRSRRDTYEVDGLPCHNIETEIRGTSPQVVLIGAHYDSIGGARGANDNGSGVAAVLALARRFAAKSTTRTLRFVAFVNEEPPYFQTPRMGSLVYAQRCKDRGDQISAMISLETIGCFSDAPGSQTYPLPTLGAFYPKTGNFIGFVGNIRSRQLLRRALGTFRQQERLPSEGAALPSFIPGVGWSDQWSFWKQGYAAIMITDTAPFRYRYYHTGADTPDKLDYDRFALVVSGVEKIIIDLAGVQR
jgi:peptidase M28-like protein